MDTQYTTQAESQEEVGSFADVLPEAWKVSNDVQCLQYSVINNRIVYLFIYILLRIPRGCHKLHGILLAV